MCTSLHLFFTDAVRFSKEGASSLETCLLLCRMQRSHRMLRFHLPIARLPSLPFNGLWRQCTVSMMPVWLCMPLGCNWTELPCACRCSWQARTTGARTASSAPRRLHSNLARRSSCVRKPHSRPSRQACRPGPLAMSTLRCCTPNLCYTLAWLQTSLCSPSTALLLNRY